MNKKLEELTEDELKQVTGGGITGNEERLLEAEKERTADSKRKIADVGHTRENGCLN